MEKEKYLAELKELLQKLEITPHSKYLSAKQVEMEFGIPSKTVLNRSNLPVTHKRFIPSVKMNGGRKKYFERKVIARMLQVNKGGVQ